MGHIFFVIFFITQIRVNNKLGKGNLNGAPADSTLISPLSLVLLDASLFLSKRHSTLQAPRKQCC